MEEGNMADVPEDLKFTESEEWVRVSGDTAVIGLTDHAQKELTDIVYVELPEVGSDMKKGSAFAVVESVKAAADIYAPVSGTVVKVNEELADTPELVNQEPFGRGWLAEVKLSVPDEINALMDVETYKQKLAEKEG